MTDVTDYEIVQAMIAHGGGFVSGLGRLFLLGDPHNRATLQAAFPHYFAKYRDIAAKRLEPQA